MKKTTALSLAERQPLAVRAAIVAAITALVHVLVVFGVVSHDQETAIAGLVDALGAVALVLWTIRSVTPNAKVVTRVTTTGDVVAGDAALPPTGSSVLMRDRDYVLPRTAAVEVNPELVAVPRHAAA